MDIHHIMNGTGIMADVIFRNRGGRLSPAPTMKYACQGRYVATRLMAHIRAYTPSKLDRIIWRWHHRAALRNRRGPVPTRHPGPRPGTHAHRPTDRTPTGTGPRRPGAGRAATERQRPQHPAVQWPRVLGKQNRPRLRRLKLQGTKRQKVPEIQGLRKHQKKHSLACKKSSHF